MNLHTLIKTVKTEQKRLGQGHGSGRGKTSGRGTKGQNARSNRSLSFEGGALPLIKRLPFLRGKGRNNSFKKTPILLSMEMLNILPKGTVVDIKKLIEYKLVHGDAKIQDVKLLANGRLTVALTIKVPFSKGAGVKIEKSGGKTEN